VASPSRSRRCPMLLRDRLRMQYLRDWTEAILLDVKRDMGWGRTLRFHQRRSL
jgi:hypothetical protein